MNLEIIKLSDNELEELETLNEAGILPDHRIIDAYTFNSLYNEEAEESV